MVFNIAGLMYVFAVSRAQGLQRSCQSCLAESLGSSHKHALLSATKLFT